MEACVTGSIAQVPKLSSERFWVSCDRKQHRPCALVLMIIVALSPVVQLSFLTTYFLITSHPVLDNPSTNPCQRLLQHSLTRADGHWGNYDEDLSKVHMMGISLNSKEGERRPSYKRGIDFRSTQIQPTISYFPSLPPEQECFHWHISLFYSFPMCSAPLQLLSFAEIRQMSLLGLSKALTRQLLLPQDSTCKPLAKYTIILPSNWPAWLLPSLAQILAPTDPAVQLGHFLSLSAVSKGQNDAAYIISSLSFTADRTSLTINFSEFDATAGPGISIRLNRKNCQLTFNLEYEVLFAKYDKSWLVLSIASLLAIRLALLQLTMYSPSPCS